MKRFTPACLLLAAIALLQTGCDKKSPDNAAPAPAEHAIAVIPKGLTQIYWQSVKAGAEAAGKDLGYKIYWNGPERESDRERQIQIVEDFIVQKVDGVVLAPADHAALVPSVEKLAALKIPCAIIDSAVDTDKYLAFASTDNHQGGVLAARRMGEILNGKGNVMVLEYAPGSSSTVERVNGFTETIQKEFPGITIVDHKYGLDTVETALQAAEDMLTRNKNVQGYFACNESTAIGALQALQSQNRAEIKVVGFDSAQALVEALRAGRIDSLVVQDPYKMGYEGVKAIDAHIKGQPVASRIDTGVVLVTRTSLDDPKIKALLHLQ